MGYYWYMVIKIIIIIKLREKQKLLIDVKQHWVKQLLVVLYGVIGGFYNTSTLR